MPATWAVVSSCARSRIRWNTRPAVGPAGPRPSGATSNPAATSPHDAPPVRFRAGCRHGVRGARSSSRLLDGRCCGWSSVVLGRGGGRRRRRPGRAHRTAGRAPAGSVGRGPRSPRTPPPGRPGRRRRWRGSRSSGTGRGRRPARTSRRSTSLASTSCRRVVRRRNRCRSADSEVHPGLAQADPPVRPGRRQRLEHDRHGPPVLRTPAAAGTGTRRRRTGGATAAPTSTGARHVSVR